MSVDGEKMTKTNTKTVHIMSKIILFVIWFLSLNIGYNYIHESVHIEIMEDYGCIDHEIKIKIFDSSLAICYEYVERDVDENPLKNVVYGAILGSGEFIEKLKEKLQKREQDKEISQLISAQERTVRLKDIGQIVSKYYGIEIKDIFVKGRKRNSVRDISIYIARRYTSFSNLDIGNYFGGISKSAVSEAFRRIQLKMKKDKRLKRDINKLIVKIEL